MRRWGSVTVLLMGLVVSTSYAAVPWKQKTLSLGEFTAINSQFINDIEIVGGADRSSVIISGDERLFRYVDAKVSGGVLNLRAPRHMHVLVRAHKLSTISVVGEGKVYGKALAALGPLSIRAAGSVKVTLRGPVNLNQVTTAGNAKVSAWWIDSPSVHVMSSDKSSVCLVGKSEELAADLFDSSRLNGERLRARQALIQTSKGAVAKVLPVDGLTAYAADKSRIEYYKMPDRLTPFSGTMGNVLHVADFE